MYTVIYSLKKLNNTMDLNPEITEILKEYGIDRSEGFLCLLAYYYNLEPEKVCSEEVIKAIALTKIVEREYEPKSHALTWNIPLYGGEESAFGWVRDWAEPWKRLNPTRADSWRDVTARMKDFFKKYPHIRKDDVYKARDMYLGTVTDVQYLKSSAKFIFNGYGASKTSELLKWAEKITEGKVDSEQKGRVVS